MKRLAALVVGLSLLISVLPGVAKKKPRKPVIESFEATLPGHAVLGLEVEEFSTDQDVQELAEAYAKGGKEAVEHSLERSEKGRYRYQLFQMTSNPNTAHPIRFIQSATHGGIRSVFIIADADDSTFVVDPYRAGPAYMARISHHGYPFSVIELRIDEQGKGTGRQVPFVAIVFNKQGVIDVDPMFGPVNGMVHLANVHTVPQ